MEAIALSFAEKHRQRVAILERKVGVQRDELVLAERDYEDLSTRYRAAKNGMPTAEVSEPAGAPPTEDDPLLKTRIDRKAVESAVEAQLEMLKKKLGRK